MSFDYYLTTRRVVLGECLLNTLWYFIAHVSKAACREGMRVVSHKQLAYVTLEQRCSRPDVVNGDASDELTEIYGTLDYDI